MRWLASLAVLGVLVAGCAGGDDPALVPASEEDWYPDKRIVFGVAPAGQAVAFPKNVMEVHEMVNITIGGQRLGSPTAPSAPPPRPTVRRSRDATSRSSCERAACSSARPSSCTTSRRSPRSTPSRDGRCRGPCTTTASCLEQVTVVTGTWGEWKTAHPETTIVARDGGIGREYEDDPLGGRDDEGPIFPIGDVDGRLPVQARVVGEIAPDGTPVAFPAIEAREALAAGGTVELAGVELVADGSQPIHSSHSPRTFMRATIRRSPFGQIASSSG